MSQEELAPVPLNNYYLFKSCIAGSVYPGIEISIRYVMDALSVDYTDDPRQSSCTGFAVHEGVMPVETNLAINARNLSLAAGSDNPNIICTCPTSYSNLKDCKKLLSKEEKLEKQVKDVMEEVNINYDVSPEINHVSDVFLTKMDDILEKTLHSLEGVRAVTHHGCHYSKFFFKDVRSGSFEKPTVLDETLKKLGCEVLDYSEQFLCCGSGLRRSIIEMEYPREILRRKFASISEAEPDIIVTQCPECTFNLDYYQESILGDALNREIPVLYISELLALLMGAKPGDIGMDMHAVPVEPFLEEYGIGVGE